MSRVFTQKQLGDYLSNNPYGCLFNVGDKELFNGNDYIFLDYLNDVNIAFDNGGCYKQNIQISIYCKDFAKRKKVVDYVHGMIQGASVYQGSDEGNYFVAIIQSEVFISA